MAGDLAEAEAKLAAGIKKSTASGGLFGFLSSPDKKFEDAYELCSEAANLFKINKKFDRAADAYMSAADMQMKLSSPHEAARCYVDAATMLKKTDPKRSAEAMLKAGSTYQRMGKLVMAAKQVQAAAELFETTLTDPEGALTHYEQAAEFYEMEDSQSAANKCQLKVAHICAALERYERAMELFETVAKAMTDAALLKYSAKEYFLKASLCRLATKDVEGTKVYVDQYQNLAAGFRDSREARLVVELCTACETEDPDQYTSVVQNYDAVSPLDQWMTTILLTIKKNIKQEEELM